MKLCLKHRIAIPFDGWRQMEVDLLYSTDRLAIELDGAQHLGNAEAYRRDRRDHRKKALLQEHGYKILRFLTDDVSKRLNEVLDVILRYMF